MDNICKKLQVMMGDEAEAIIAYNKLKNEMSPEHKDRINTIEEYIEDEYKHLQGVFNMMKEMGCPIEKSEEIEAKLKDIVIEEDKEKKTIEVS